MKMKKLMICAFLLCLLSCGQTEKERVREVALNFSEDYFNMKLKKAKLYCLPDLYPIFNFREHNRVMWEEKYGKCSSNASVRILECEVNEEMNVAYAIVEIQNFLRIDYLKQEMQTIPCDTFELTLVRQQNKQWKIKDPI